MAFLDRFKAAKANKSPDNAIEERDFIIPMGVASSMAWGSNELKHLKDYMEVAEVASIINIKARAFSSMRLEAVNKTTGKPFQSRETEVIKTPNYFQGQKEFLRQTKLFHEIFGNEIIYFLRANDMPVRSMFTLPPILVDIDEAEGVPYWLQREFPESIKYHIEWGGRRLALDNSDICHINNTKVKVLPDDVHWGASTMASLQGPISNIRAAYEARNVMIENRGALGILSNNSADGMGATMPLLPEEKEELQNDYRKFGMSKDKWQIIITSLNLRWQQMSIDTDKLKLFEEVKADTEQLCDAYGVPFELLANEKGTTFENRRTAEKTFYTGTIIPEAEEWVGAINRKLKTSNLPWEYRASFDHLDIFAENQKDRAQSLAILINGLSKALADGAITLDEYRGELAKLKIGS